MSDTLPAKATPIALAKLIGENIGFLEGRAIAVADCDLEKLRKDQQSLPRLPACWVALMGEVTDNSGNTASQGFNITETISVIFWLKPEKYRNDAGAETPYYAFYDYSNIRNMLLSVLTKWPQEQCSVIWYTDMEVDVEEFAVMVVFTLKNKFKYELGVDESSVEDLLELSKTVICHQMPEFVRCCECAEPEPPSKC